MNLYKGSTDFDENKSIMPETCETVVKKVYKLCRGEHTRCTKGQGKKVTLFKASLLKATIPTITCGDESIEKVCLLDKHLGNDCERISSRTCDSGPTVNHLVQ